MPISSSIRGSSRQPARVFTRRSRNTFVPKNRSSSSRASVPIRLIIAPPRPMTIGFWDSRSTRMLQNSRVLRLLKGLGYTYIHLGSWYEPTKVNRFADINYPGAKLTNLAQDFTLKFLNITALAPLGLSKYSHRESVLQKFRELFQVAERPGPKFVFLHMLVPHSPFVFGPQGEVLQVDDLIRRPVEQKYADQVRYLNRRIEELVAVIQSRAKISPVIIIQSDEGPGKSETPVNSLSRFRPKRRPSLKNFIQFGILNACLFPGKDKSIFYNSISPVNTFRLLFNSYFGARYPLLPDISFKAKESRTQVLAFKAVPSSFFELNGRIRTGKALNPRRPDIRAGGKKPQAR